MIALPVKTMARWVVGRCVRFAPLVATAMIVLAAAALYHAAGHLGIHSNTADLLDPALEFRQRHDQYTEQFPAYDDTLVAVIQAPAPELARAAADRLAARLEQPGAPFHGVYQPRGGDFFDRHALLFAERERLAAMADRTARMQPLVERFRQNPDLAGLLSTLALALSGGGNAAAQELEPLLDGVATVLDDPAAAPISWQRVFTGDEEVNASARTSLVAVAEMDYAQVFAGRSALRAMRTAIDEIEAESPGVGIRLTGKVALQHEELTSALGGAQLAGLLALGFVTVVLLLGLRSATLIVTALTALIGGLCLSAGVATVTVGHLNLISIAFAVLYVGLGVNYAIHYLVRYREALQEGLGKAAAIVTAGERLGSPLLLCTVTTALGFFAFVPTAYAGVSELGIIAGTAMFITLAVTYTLLPALLTLLPQPRASLHVTGLAIPRGLSALPARRPRTLLLVTALLVAAAIAGSLQIRFDDDPLNLRDPMSESVQTLRDLLADGDGQRGLALVVEDRERLAAVRAELAADPAVERTIALDDFVPADQEEKLAAIRRLADSLAPLLAADTPLPGAAPSPGELQDSAARLAAALPGDVPAAARLQPRLSALAEADPADVDSERLQQRVLGLLPQALERLAVAFEAGTLARADLPRKLVRRYRSAEGSHLVQILPAANLDDGQAREEFVDRVLAIAPQATGSAVLERESGRAVVAAFRQALLAAVVGISLVLLLLLRDARRSAAVLTPLFVGGVFTTAAMVLFGLPFNFANIIALPLLLGIGVDNGIHMVARGSTQGIPAAELMRTSTARAMLFGALTTTLSFGNLAVSDHQGTASMGIVLALGMLLILLATLAILPALLQLIREHEGDGDAGLAR